MLSEEQVENALNESSRFVEECGHYKRACSECTAVVSPYGIQFQDKCAFMLTLYFQQLRAEDFYEYKKVMTWH